jgi:ParB-like chromosome segregation protein Spo0J
MVNLPVSIESVDSLALHPDNPREGDIGAIVTSIRQNGWFGSVVVQKSTGYVLAGNHRLQAAKICGIKEVPVFWVDCDDERAKAILLADNKTAELASWNDHALLALLQEADAGSYLLDTAFDQDDIQKLLSKLNADESPDGDVCPTCGSKRKKGR